MGAIGCVSNRQQRCSLANGNSRITLLNMNKRYLHKGIVGGKTQLSGLINNQTDTFAQQYFGVRLIDITDMIKAKT